MNTDPITRVLCRIEETRAPAPPRSSIKASSPTSTSRNARYDDGFGDLDGLAALTPAPEPCKREDRVLGKVGVGSWPSCADLTFT
jgi:hypothetical protein